jgi:hypothetical protein
MSNKIKTINGEKYEILSSGVHRKIASNTSFSEDSIVETGLESMSIEPSKKKESEKSISAKFKAINESTKKALGKSDKKKSK